MRLDADDRLEPTYVEQTLAALRDHPDAHFAYTPARFFGARTGTFPTEPFAVETLSERNYVNACALIRRESLHQVGGYNCNMTGSRNEDWDFWLSFAERGLPGVMVPHQLLWWRQHETGSRGTLRLNSLSDLRREAHMALLLRNNHPSLFSSADAPPPPLTFTDSTVQARSVAALRRAAARSVRGDADIPGWSVWIRRTNNGPPTCVHQLMICRHNFR